jgi:glutamine---fructose-6-phosphate transaminase (isomerizing)
VPDYSLTHNLIRIFSVDHTHSNTYQEIMNQPAAWAEAVQVVAQHKASLQAVDLEGYTQVLFTGCGSTFYLSLAAAALLQSETGKISRGLPASELLLNPLSAYPGKRGRTLLVAVSRSGSTTETLRAIQAFRQEQPGEVITVTNYPESPLAGMGNINLIIPAGREESVAQTRSFASIYVACAAISAVLGADEGLSSTLEALPAVGNRLLRDFNAVAQRWGEDSHLNQFFYLGTGQRYGLACEVSLKMKEMALTVSEPFRFLEFRHGPMSMITPQTLVVGLLSEASRAQEEAVLREMHALGGQIFALADSEADVSFASDLPERARGVLYLPVLQLMAYYRSVSRGLNPDNPHNLTKVIELSQL